MSERLPVPDWDRPGETWRVEPETSVEWAVGVQGPCEPCYRGRPKLWTPAAAAIVKRDGQTYGYCFAHLREGRMWIENGQVVSWALRL